MSGILLYHRIAALDPDPYDLCVTPEAFRQQMELVARTCEPLGLEALRQAAERGDLPRRAAAITFDDGYVDALTASDVLDALHLPATFFVNTNAGEETYHDTLARVFLERHPLPANLDLVIEGHAVHLPCGDERERYAAFKAIGEIGWPLQADGRQRMLAALHQWSGVDLAPRASHRVMTHAELRALDSRPAQDIGGHTDNHLFMPAQSPATKKQEIAGNRRHLEEVLGRPIPAFAYPYGATDDETVGICRELGLSTAVTVVGARVESFTSPLLLPRFEVKQGPPARFESLLRDALD